MRADKALDGVSVVTGVVTSDGEPVRDVEVTLFGWLAEDERFWDERTGYTDDEGRYRIPVGRAGHYTLHFRGESAAPAVDSAWLEGESAPAAVNAPGVFEIGNDVARIERDKVLSRPTLADLTGTVTDQGGGR